MYTLCVVSRVGVRCVPAFSHPSSHIAIMSTGPKCQNYQAADLVKFASVSISVF